MKPTMIFIIILLSLITLYLILDFIVAYFATKLMVEPYCAPLDESLEKELTRRNITHEEFNHFFQFEHFTINSKYGYHIQASYIPKQKDVKFADGKERVVIFVHGWTCHRFSMLSYAKIYLQLGFHVFIYDHRYHYESDKKIITMGDKEADDLQSVLQEIIRRLGNHIVIGTHGESMGSATAMIHAGRYHSVDFVVEDCGYSSLKELMIYQCKELRHLPLFPTIFFANLVFKMKTGSFYKDIQPAKLLSTCDDIPMFFIHGAKDRFVPSYMVYQNYDAKNGFKRIKIYPDCKHASCQIQHPKEYEKDVQEFLKQARIIDEMKL